MNKGRLEAFSDGVMAIIITIMVLNMKAPHGPELGALVPVLPAFLSYALSFVYVGIYWNNHHHVFQAVERVNGPTLWANLHLLFWLSLTPIVTQWMGESNFAAWPTAVYGMVLLLCAVAWEVERRVLIRLHDRDSALVRAVGHDNLKEWASLALYGMAVGTAFVHPWIACALYSVVAVIWLIPDRRIEREMGTERAEKVVDTDHQTKGNEK